MKQTLKRIPGVKKASTLLRSVRENPHLIERAQHAAFLRNNPARAVVAPTESEARLIDALREDVATLPAEVSDTNAPAAEQKWRSFKNELRRKMLNDDPRGFLSWDVVSSTMGGTLRAPDYRTLTRYPFWKEWKELLLKHTPLSFEVPYFKLPQADGTTLYNAFNLAQLRSHDVTDLSDTSYIIDFGAGYGSMCAVNKALGFAGTYVLFDWPEFSLIQKFYLSLRGIDLGRIKFVSSLEELAALNLTGDGLLIATWSLSETSLAFRTEFLKAVKPRYYLISYQLEFGGIDNVQYFSEFVAEHPEVTWIDYPVFNFTGAGNRYLLGKRSA